MQGHFDTANRPKVSLTIQSVDSGQTVEKLALFDTGQDVALSLPVIDLVRLGATLATTGISEFGNGQRAAVLYFKVRVVIDGEKRDVLAAMIENPEADEAIAGVALFKEYKVSIDFASRTIDFEKRT